MTSDRRRYLLAMLLVSLLCSDTVRGFSLRQHASQKNNQLTGALRVVEREKRRVLFDERGTHDWDNLNPDDSEPFYEWGDAEPLQFPRYDPYGYDTYEYPDNDLASPQDLDTDTLLQKNDEQAQPDLFGEDEDSSLSKQELQDIFGNEAPEEAEGEEEAPPAADKRKVGLTPEQVDRLLAAVDTSEEDILSQPDALTQPADIDEQQPDSDERSSVSDSEIQDIFGEDPGEVSEENQGAQAGADSAAGEEPIDTEDNQTEETDDWSYTPIDSNINKEWLINQYIEGMAGDQLAPMKTKRSNRRALERQELEPYGLATDESSDSATVQLENELTEAKEDLKLLKYLLHLEDEENENLAKALNLATMGQTERTDKYLQNEIGLIKDAMDDEVGIQEVKDVVDIVDAMEGEEAPEEDVPDADLPERFEDLSFTDKRGDPSLEDLSDTDFLDEDEIPLDSDNLDSDVTVMDNDITEEDLVDLLIANKLQQLLSQSRDEEDAGYDKEDGLQAWYEAPVPPSLHNRASESYINPLTKQIWQQLQDPGESENYINPLTKQIWQQQQDNEVSKRGYADDDEAALNYVELSPIDLANLEASIIGAALEEEAACPAINLADNCAFVAQFGMALDDEATALCNRHQLCYTCGASLDLSSVDCDRGYLSEAARLCDEDQGCDDEAAGLFLLMLQHHSFLPLQNNPDQCAHSCTENLISGTIVGLNK